MCFDQLMFLVQTWSNTNLTYRITYLKFNGRHYIEYIYTFLYTDIYIHICTFIYTYTYVLEFHTYQCMFWLHSVLNCLKRLHTTLSLGISKCLTIWNNYEIYSRWVLFSNTFTRTSTLSIWLQMFMSYVHFDIQSVHVWIDSLWPGPFPSLSLFNLQLRSCSDPCHHFKGHGTNDHQDTTFPQAVPWICWAKAARSLS